MALTNNLVAYWKFDESSGNAADSIGSNTLTNTNTTYAAAKINNGAVFANSNCTFLKATSGLGTTTTLTMAIWAKWSTTVDTIFFDVHSSGGINSGTIKLNDNAGGGSAGYVSFITYNGSSHSTVSSTNTYNDGAWHYIVAQVNGANAYLYIDNIQVGTAASGTFAVDLDTIRISSNGSVQWFNGTADEAGIWTRVVGGGIVGNGNPCTGELLSLYNSGNGFQYPFITFIANSFRRLYQAVIRASSY